MGKSKAPRCPSCVTKFRSVQGRKTHIRDHAMKRVYMKQKGKWIAVGWLCPNCYMGFIDKPKRPCPHCGADLNMYDWRCPRCGKFYDAKYGKLVEEAKAITQR